MASYVSMTGKGFFWRGCGGRATGLAAPVCLLAGGTDEPWRLHARFRHLHFRALHDLGAKGMVRGMATISRPDQFCEGYTID